MRSPDILAPPPQLLTSRPALLTSSQQLWHWACNTGHSLSQPPVSWGITHPASTGGSICSRAHGLQGTDWQALQHISFQSTMHSPLRPQAHSPGNAAQALHQHLQAGCGRPVLHRTGP